MLCETLKTRWTFLAFKGSAPWGGVKPASESLSHNVHHVTHTVTHITLINKINLSLALHPPLQSSSWLALHAVTCTKQKSVWDQMTSSLLSAHLPSPQTRTSPSAATADACWLWSLLTNAENMICKVTFWKIWNNAYLMGIIRFCQCWSYAMCEGRGGWWCGACRKLVFTKIFCWMLSHQQLQSYLN